MDATVVRIAVGFCLAFGSGAATSYVALRSGAPRVTDIPTRTATIDAMADEVGLDLAQRASAHAVSDRHAERLRQVRQRAAPDLAAIRSDVRGEIRASLDEGQRRRFEAFCARRDQQRSRADD